MENIILILLLAMGASFVQRVTGFGFGIFIMTALAGNMVFSHIPNRIFSYVVYAYIGISGLIILITA